MHKTKIKIHCESCGSLSAIKNGKTIKFIPCICPRKHLDIVVTPDGHIIKTRKDIQIDYRNFKPIEGGEI